MSEERDAHIFLEDVRQRLVLRRSLRAASFVVTAAAAGFLVYAVAWRSVGHAVPWGGFAAAVVVALVAWTAWVSLGKTGVGEAAREADARFGFKDGFVSLVGFSGRTGEVYALQRESVEASMAGASAEAVPLEVPRRWVAGGAGMLVVGVYLSTLPPSAAVQERLDAEAATLAKSSEVREELEAQIEEILSSLDDEEKEALTPEAVRSWLGELEATPDAKEALRQLARFEQKLARSAAGLETREDEEALGLAAAELSRSGEPAARQVGIQLGAKHYGNAARELEELGPNHKKHRTPKERAAVAKKLRETTRRLAKGANSRSSGRMATLSRELEVSAQALADLPEMDPDLQECRDRQQ